MATKFFNRFIVPALILGMLFFTSGTSAFAVVPCDWILQYNPDPDPNANQLRAVWGPSDTEVFAVGDYGTILYTSDNGATWAAMTSGLTVNIYGVWGSSAANVFAVGDSGNIRKYDGSTWSAMTSGTTKRLRDLWGSAANNVIAVGEDGTIRKYNGTSWGSMTSGTTLTLQGVWGSSATNIFAVGGAKDGQTGSAIVQKYNGTAWSNILTYTSIPRFHDAWGTSDTNVYVVGEAGTILHTTDGGTNWTAMPVPTGVNTVTLRDIWGTSDSDIFAVGDGPAVPNGSTILHYDGSAWSIMSHPRDDKVVRLHGVWGSDTDNFFAVGEPFIEVDAITKHGTIEHYYGPCPTLISLSSFTATPFSKAVVIEWTTAAEIDNAGFNVYRAESAEGPYLKINEDLIFAQGSSTEGSSYEIVDEGLKNRKTYYYQLEDIDFSGQSTFHGPIKATPRWVYGNK
jgi:photosystem II stability/assembly factor-like uncharacterized protein